MKQIRKIVGLALVLSLGLITVAVFASGSLDSSITNQDEKVDEIDFINRYGLGETAFMMYGAEKLAEFTDGETFQSWVASIKETKTYRVLSYLVPAVALCFVLYYIWSAAMVYCISGAPGLDNAHGFCSTVSEIGSTSEWVVGGITSYLEPLRESAVSFIRDTHHCLSAGTLDSSSSICGVNLACQGFSPCLGQVTANAQNALCPIYVQNEMVNVTCDSGIAACLPFCQKVSYFVENIIGKL